MCGICGVVAADRREPEANARVARRMMAAMRHRGPDEDGELIDAGLALGMRRLTIIDRATGHQPMSNEDGTVSVMFNGEIYNFGALRRELEARGHRFHTASDTEAIAHSYEEWGDECLAHLRGMFAVAIYDRRARRLLLARDRLGIKPLYYTRRGGRLLFASEVRALLASGDVPARLSADGLDSYLLFGSVAEPLTIIDGVRSMPPGHAMAVSIDADGPGASDDVAPRAYWSLASGVAGAGGAVGVAGVGVTDAAGDVGGRSDARRREALRELLEESVRLHLISDEPLGIFLSGGVDSTTIAALASRVRDGVRCYTIRFREAAYDESDVARRTAKALGVEQCELLVEPDEMLDGLDAAIGALDQPSVDGINTYCVSGAVRRAGAKVALSGLGGDELFGGYRTFAWMPALSRLSNVARRVPAPVRHAGARALACAGGWLGRAGETDRIAALCREPSALPHPFFFARTIFAPDEAGALVRRGAAGGRALRTMAAATSHAGVDAAEQAGGRATDDAAAWRGWLDETAVLARRSGGAFSAVSCLEMRSYMLNTLLRDADAMSMAHSLELRVPFLDHPVVEFVCALPDAVKRRGGAYKPLLVDALDDVIPAEVSERPKRGFTFPWELWMRGRLAPRVQSGLREIAPALAEHLDQARVAAVWEPFARGRAAWLRPWSLFVMNEWVRRHA